ncbi:uncharacterized protein PAC_06978 [Phialocephala subalpina]|uniref:Uncharacterized protein n=1 Tax=Phialocephala subalpina TaxID=576137 RepID=A0A1L7WWF9_9HELO|nr:uncharacterized protein PAC_06978 [Phialocephala subalpina]
MFLNSSLWNHEHEFSNRTQPSPSTSIPRRRPLARSAFSTPIPRKPTIYEDSPTIILRPERPLSDIPRIKDPIVRFQEVDQETMSEDGRSIANSEGSETTAGGGKRRRRSIRNTTTYQLAHPAPTLTQKQRLLQIRPKLLLQLQRLSPGSRPKPTLDILPSTIVVPRLAKRFPRMFRGKGELGANDVIVVKSEEYDAGYETVVDESDSDEEGLARRDLVAVICQMRRDLGGSQGKAEIVLSDGSVWIGSPLPNGLYEFVTTDERGNTTTARWVRRSTKRRSVDVSDVTNLNRDIKFTFSIIDPSTRRHPILATLTQNTLDIPDTFTSVSPSAGRHPPTSPIPRLAGETNEDDEGYPPERSTHVIDESMKVLIQVTGTWVALRQGWSPYFRYNDAMATPSSQSLSAGRARASSLTPESIRPAAAGTTSSTPESCNSTLGAVLCGKKRRSSVKASPTNGIPPQNDRFVPPKRSLSTGTAFVQRAAARRAGQPSTVASDSEGESTSFTIPPTDKPNAHKHMSTPPSLTPPGSSTTTPETPTRPQRRAQSAYIPTSALQNGFTSRSLDTDGTTTPPLKPVDLVARVKHGRWKAFTNFFRRKRNTSSTD